MTERFDVVVVGGGSGGYVGAIRGAQLGLRVAVVEADKVGGTCLHRGCIPTKALLQSAFLLDQLRHADRLGVRTGEVSFDYATAGKRRDEVVSQLHRGVEFLLKKNKVTLMRGRGWLRGPGTVAVSGGKSGDAELEAGTVLLATGSRPRQILGMHSDGQQILTSDDALFLDRIPRSVVVLGAGAVGVEFASFYRSAGSEVTLVEMAPRLVPLEDDAIGVELRKQFEARGIVCRTGAKLDPASLERNEGGIAVTIQTGDGEERLQAEVLLVAVGRTANIEEIGLDSTAVEVDRGLIKADAMQRTAQAGISAVGDCVGGFQLAHKAMHEGVIAMEAIAGRDPHPLESRLVPRTTYCSPQIASIGLSESEAEQAGHDVATGVFPFSANGRAMIWGETGGFAKVVSDRKTDTVLGVHLIGPEVTELIHGPAIAALLEGTPFELSRAVAPHPTLSEVLGEAALAVSGQAIHI